MKNEEIVNESCEQTQETLLSSLSRGQMKQVLKDVSDGILNEVKVLLYPLRRAFSGDVNAAMLVYETEEF